MIDLHVVSCMVEVNFCDRNFFVAKEGREACSLLRVKEFVERKFGVCGVIEEKGFEEPESV